MKKYKDIIINVLSSAIPILLMQIVLIPIFSLSNSNKNFGLFLLVLTLVNIISPIFGNTLNNIRLVNKNNKRISESAYLNTLFILIILDIFITSIFLIFWKLSISDIILINIWASSLLVRSYLFVYLRLDLNYMKIFKISALNGIILIIGALLIYFQGFNFYSVLIISELATIFLMILNSLDYLKEYNFEFLDKAKIQEYSSLLCSNAISNLLNYSDRIFIGLILGTKFVPLFFVATILGKMSNLIINPMVSVLLSYEVDNKSDSSKKKSKLMFISAILISLVIALLVSLASNFFIQILYPGYIEKVEGLILVSNFGVILLSTTAILQMKIIAKSMFYINLAINISSLLFLILFGYIFMNIYGVLGFSIALIITALLKHLMIYISINKFPSEVNK